MSEKRRAPECAACGKFSEGNASIHRDGFGEGPEVELCDECGMAELPTCETVWAMIRARRGPCRVVWLDERRSK